jgi:flagellar motor switch protein FliG
MTTVAAAANRAMASTTGAQPAPASTQVATSPTQRPATAMTGAQKVAVLYMALGPERTAAISARLSQEEVESIGFEVARMGVAQGDIVTGVLEEWLHTMRAAESLAEGGIEVAREILEKQFGAQRAAQILKRIHGQITEHAGLERLRKADPQQLAGTLRNEHPQTIALVLAHLDQLHTAAILKEIPPQVGREIVYRMAVMDKVSPEMLRLIETELGSEIALNLADSMTMSGGPAAVAAVLNSLAPSLEKELLDGVAERNPDLCEQIKALMFTFEDIVNLDNRSMQRLLREVDSRELALALKVASDELKDAMYAGMTQRALAALKDDLELMGPARLRDIETAQAKIVLAVRRLEEEGEIIISMGGGGEDVVVA